MRWFKLTLAYEGTAFHGWQMQVGRRTVQASLERAIEQVTQQPTRVTACGRTDAGVHALGQVVSCQLATRLEPGILLRALNANLTDDVRVIGCREVPPGFDAIVHCQSKTYWYWLRDRRIPELFWREMAWFVPHCLDVPAMQCAAETLIGTHDFRAFQSSGSPRKTTVRTVSALGVERQRVGWADLVRLAITADGFLYNMVRNIVGTLVEVGLGKQPADWPRQLLAQRDRRRAGPTAPPHGLFLVQADYPAPWAG